MNIQIMWRMVSKRISAFSHDPTQWQRIPSGPQINLHVLYTTWSYSVSKNTLWSPNHSPCFLHYILFILPMIFRPRSKNTNKSNKSKWLNSGKVHRKHRLTIFNCCHNTFKFVVFEVIIQLQYFFFSFPSFKLPFWTISLLLEA